MTTRAQMWVASMAKGAPGTNSSRSRVALLPMRVALAQLRHQVQGDHQGGDGAVEGILGGIRVAGSIRLAHGQQERPAQVREAVPIPLQAPRRIEGEQVRTETDFAELGVGDREVRREPGHRNAGCLRTATAGGDGTQRRVNVQTEQLNRGLVRGAVEQVAGTTVEVHDDGPRLGQRAGQDAGRPGQRREVLRLALISRVAGGIQHGLETLGVDGGFLFSHWEGWG